MSTQPEPAKVRVAEPETATAQDRKDYQFLLEENLRLLREVEALSKTALTYDQKTAELRKQVTDRDLKLAKSKTFAKLRKFFATLHILLGLGVGALGPTLWLTHRSPAEACWGILGGVVWLIATTVYIDYLADEEKRQS